MKALPESVEVGVAVGVEGAVGVEVGVRGALAVLLAVGVEVGVLVPVELPVPVLVGVCGAVALLDREVLALLEGEAPAVRDAVGVAEMVVLALTVLLVVSEAVPVPVPVGEPEGVGVGVRAAVALPEKEVLLVAEALAPSERDAVGLVLGEEGALTVLLGVGVGELVLEPVALPVPLPLGV
jgi:hypothetical protein